MMTIFIIQFNNQAKQFMPKVYPGKRRGQGKNKYYYRGTQQNRNRSNSTDRVRRTPYRDKPHFSQNFKRGNFRRIHKENYRNSNRFDKSMRRPKNSQIAGNYRRNDKIAIGQKQVQEQAQIET